MAVITYTKYNPEHYSVHVGKEYIGGLELQEKAWHTPKPKWVFDPIIDHGYLATRAPTLAQCKTILEREVVRNWYPDRSGWSSREVDYVEEEDPADADSPGKPRKPLKDTAGYVSSMKTDFGWVVIYDRNTGGDWIDADSRWVVAAFDHELDNIGLLEASTKKEAREYVAATRDGDLIEWVNLPPPSPQPAAVAQPAMEP